MRGKNIVVYSAMMLFLFFSQTGFAQEIEKKFGIGARMSILEGSSDDIDGYVEFELNDSLLYGINFYYYLNNFISFELSLESTEQEMKTNVLGISTDSGDLEQDSILFTIHSHFPTNTRLTPYLGLGIGYYFNKLQVNDNFRSLIPGASMEMDDNIGYHINAGFDFFLTEKFALNLDLRYRWMETDLILTSPGYSGDTNFDVHSFVIGMGIKYLF